MRRESRQIAPQFFRALIQPDTLNVEARTVEVVFSTGAPVLRGYWDQFYEELSMDSAHVRMDRLNNGAPMLDGHQGFTSEDVRGVVVAASLRDGKGYATMRFARAEDDPAADRLFRKVQDGIIQNVSVGYRVYQVQKTDRAIAGVPVMRVIDWEPFEISFVPIGADDGAGTRSASAATNPCEQEIEDMKIETQERAQPEAEKPADPAAVPVNADAVRAEVLASERQRVQDIQAATRALGADGAAIADKATKDGTSADAVRKLVLDTLASRTAIDSAAPITMGESERDKYLRGVENALIVRSGLAPQVRSAIEKGLVPSGFDANAGEFRGMSLFEMARDYCERNGVRTRGMDRMSVVSQAFTLRAANVSTSDFAVALENTMHKVLQAAYALATDTHTAFTKVGYVPDFRIQPLYRMGNFSTLDALTENGGFKYKYLSDAEKETIQLATKGNKVTITRPMIVNDDMGVFNDIVPKLGRAAKLSEEAAVYALLASNAGLGPDMSDGKTLFHADHGNIGTGAALSVDSIDADRVLMASQMDPSANEYLDIRPYAVLVPIALGGKARLYNQSVYDIDASNKLQMPNRVAGLFNVVVDTPRLSGTRRYMFADPSLYPVIEKIYLEGASGPVIETQDSWDRDGAEVRIRHDFQVGARDWRGALTNAGA